MRKWVVYEVWSRARVVEAETYEDALSKHDPEAIPKGFNLGNWHAVPCDAQPTGVYEDWHGPADAPKWRRQG